MATRERKARPLKALLEGARRNRYKVIHERNLLILALAKHAEGFSAHVVPTADPGTWKHVVCLHTPAGQIHWKLSPKDAEDFEGVLAFDKKTDWDGCKAPEKGERLERLHTPPRGYIDSESA